MTVSGLPAGGNIIAEAARAVHYERLVRCRAERASRVSTKRNIQKHASFAGVLGVGSAWQFGSKLRPLDDVEAH